MFTAIDRTPATELNTRIANLQAHLAEQGLDARGAGQGAAAGG